MAFEFIILGDTHGFLDDFSKIKEIILKHRPEFVLSQQMQNIKLITKKDYEEFLSRQKMTEIVSFDEIKDLVSLCHSQDIKLIGIDKENYGFNKKKQLIVTGEIEGTEQDFNEIEFIVDKRYELQKSLIQTIKSEKPVFIITGAWYLQFYLQEFINTLFVYPAKDSKLVFEPLDGVEFIEKIS